MERGRFGYPERRDGATRFRLSGGEHRAKGRARGRPGVDHRRRRPAAASEQSPAAAGRDRSELRGRPDCHALRVRLAAQLVRAHRRRAAPPAPTPLRTPTTLSSPPRNQYNLLYRYGIKAPRHLHNKRYYARFLLEHGQMQSSSEAGFNLIHLIRIFALM